MKRRGLGCLTTGGLIAMVFSFIAVGFSYAATGNRMFSPGDLNAQSSGKQIGGVHSHAELEAECAACHPAFWQKTIMTDLCLECHQDIIGQLADGSSLHSAVIVRIRIKLIAAIVIQTMAAWMPARQNIWQMTLSMNWWDIHWPGTARLSGNGRLCVQTAMLMVSRIFCLQSA